MLALPPALFMGRPNYLLFFAFLCCFLMRPHFLFFHHSKNFERSLFSWDVLQNLGFCIVPYGYGPSACDVGTLLRHFVFQTHPLLELIVRSGLMIFLNVQCSCPTGYSLLAIFIFYPPDWMDTSRKYIRHLVFHSCLYFIVTINFVI